MAKDKKSFVLYCDLKSTVDKLTDEEAGKLFKHVLDYVNDLDPQAPDRITEISFEPIKQQLKRDLKKYENIVERNRSNGKKGGRPKKPTGLFGNPKKPKKADNDNGSDSDTVNDSVSDNDNEKKIVPHWNEDIGANGFRIKKDENGSQE